MKRTILLLTSALLIGVCTAQALAQGIPKQIVKKPDAQLAAEAWLKLVDAGHYGPSWAAAATFFRQTVTKEQWMQAAGGVRHALGHVKSRKLKKIMYAHKLPGAPDGTYAVIRYTTVFQHKSPAVETVTPMQEKNGQWRVSGYYIK